MIRRLTSIWIALALFGAFGAWADEQFKIKHKVGSGFTVETPDGNHTLNIGGRVQLRHTFEDYDSDRNAEDKSNFTVERLRIWLKGKVFKDFGYEFQADFGKNTSTLKDGVLEWLKYERARIKLGQFKTAFDRQQLTSSGRQTFVDRSLAARAFGIGRDIGVMLHGSAAEKKFQYNLGVYNGEGEGGSNPNNGHLVVGRISFNPNGDFGLSESDISHSEKHLWFFDVAGAFNSARINRDWDGSGKVGGKNDEADITSFVAGVGYRHKGIYAQGEYYLQEDDPNLATANKIKGRGWYAQTGWTFVPDKWELAVRYSAIDADKDISRDDKTEIVFGMNRFIKKAGHSLKFSADVAQLKEEIPAGGDFRDFRSRVGFQIVY